MYFAAWVTDLARKTATSPDLQMLLTAHRNGPCSSMVAFGTGIRVVNAQPCLSETVLFGLPNSQQIVGETSGLKLGCVV